MKIVATETQVLKDSPLSRVNSLCDQFRQQWKQSSTSSLGEYLTQVPEGLRETLLRNLLHIDVQCRRDAGQQPSKEQYVEQLPQFERVIGEEFLESTQRYVSCAVDTVSASGGSTRKLEMPELLRLGDYVIEGELGRGGMGIVFAARHVRHGTQVALKTLPTVNATDLHRFKQEFRSLADINHPNLVGLHTLQADGGQWFFTMDLINGTDFRSYVRPEGRLNLTRLRDSLAQLVRGVNALHDHKIMHRDLKPSNVMISGEGQVQLLDFGLVVDLNRMALGDELTIGGTPPYMAPEQFQVTVTTPAADWYSVGIMLYEALAGRLPFSGSVQEIFRAKQNTDPPPIGDAVPEDLVKLCRMLLSRRAEDRPEAQQIIAVASPFQASEGTGRTVFQVQNHTGLPAERLVGRDDQLHEIDKVIGSYEASASPQVIFISGRSGEGKTVLAEHFLKRFRVDASFTLLAGRCYDRESVPFKAVDTMIDALCNRLSAMSDRKVRELLTEDVAVLAELFPVLCRVREIARLPRIRLENLELQQVRRLTAGALRELMCRLSEQTKLVCFIDDLQWGDGDSAELLLEVLKWPGAPNVLLLGTYRSDEADSSRFLEAWDAGKEQLNHDLPQYDCQLLPLSRQQCIELVVEVVGLDNASMRERAAQMAQETGGNPFLLAELASCYNPQLTSTQPTQMEEVLERKLSVLPADARALLDVVSVSGHAMTADEATCTAGHDSVPLSTLTRMRSERLLRMIGDDQAMMIDTYHDRIRETVLRNMKTETRTGLHVALAETIIASGGGKAATTDHAAVETEQRISPRVYDLAYHFYQAGDDRAFDYQRQAGEAAMQAYAMNNAIDHFEKAKEVIPDDCDRSTRYRLSSRMGQACGKANRMGEGVKHYQAASSYSSGSIEHASALIGTGDLQNRIGEFDQAIASFDEALKELGYSRATWLPWQLAEISWYFAICCLRWLVRPHKSLPARRTAEIAAATYHNISIVLMTDGDVATYAHCSTKFAFTALRSGSAQQITFGFLKLAHNAGVCSLWLLSKWMLRRGERFALRCPDDATVAANIESYFGFCGFFLGQLDNAERRVTAALDLFDHVGESYFRKGNIHVLRHIHAARGDSIRELSTAEDELSFASALSDFEFSCFAEYGIANALARLGRTTEAMEHADKSLALIEGRGRQVSEAIALNHVGFVLLQGSDYSGAIDALDRSRRLIQARGLFLEYTVYTYSRLLESLLGPDWRTRPDKITLRRAKQVCKWSSFFGWRFPNVRPGAHRARGRLLTAMGKYRQARRSFARSISAAREFGADYELARALLDLAVVSHDRADELRSEATSILNRLKAVIPYAEKWQLGNDSDESFIAPPRR